MNNVLTPRGKIMLSLVAFCIVGLMIGAIAYHFHRAELAEQRAQQAHVITQAQAESLTQMQNELRLNKANAEAMMQFMARAQSGGVPAVNHFTVTAPTTQAAAEQVAQRINDRDPKLPPAALEKTDTTAVKPMTQTADQPYSVGVFKQNNYRGWEDSIGYGRHGGDSYIPIEIQRNFSKDEAASIEYHAGGRESGYEIKYTKMTDKPFILF